MEKDNEDECKNHKILKDHYCITCSSLICNRCCSSHFQHTILFPDQLSELMIEESKKKIIWETKKKMDDSKNKLFSLYENFQKELENEKMSIEKQNIQEKQLVKDIDLQLISQIFKRNNLSNAQNSKLISWTQDLEKNSKYLSTIKTELNGMTTYFKNYQISNQNEEISKEIHQKIYCFRDNIAIIYNPLLKKSEFAILNKSIPNYTVSISIDNKIYCTGGEYQEVSLDNVYEINLQTKNVIEKKKMQFARYYHNICCDSKYIYVIGGYNDKKGICLVECEYYDIEKDEWKLLPNRNQKNSCFSCFLFLIKICCFLLQEMIEIIT